MSKLFADLMEKQSPAPASARNSDPPSISPAAPTLPADPVLALPIETPPPAQTPGPETPLATQPTVQPMLQPTNPATMVATNLATIALTKTDLEELRVTPHQGQTYRFTEDELNWMRDRAYSLSRALGRKVGQNDLLRLALKLLRKGVADHPRQLEEIFEPII